MARRCPICGTQNSTCGPSGQGIQPIGIDRKEGDMSGDLKMYDVELENGLSTTLRLSDADAAKRGLTKPRATAKARTPQNKAKSAANKAAQADALGDE